MATLSENTRASKIFKRFVSTFAVCPPPWSIWKIRIYVTSFLMVIIWMFCFEMYGRITTNFINIVHSSTRTIVIGTINTTTDFLCNIIITLPAICSSAKFENTIAEELQKIDIILTKYNQNIQQKRSRSPCTHLIVLNLFYLGLVLNDISVWFNPDYKDYHQQFYIFDQFYRYRASILVIYIYYLVKGILWRISSINEAIERTFEYVYLDDIQHGSQTLSHLEETIENMSLLHAKLSNVIKSFNEIFGWQMLSVLLNYILLFMVTYEMGLRIASRNLQNTNWQFIIWFICSMVYAAIAVCAITSICDKTTFEARRTTDLTYFYLYNLNLSKQHKEQASLVRALTTFVRQTRSDASIRFSAAGFFYIDYSTLFTLIQLLMSYLIVLIQFE